MYGRLSVFVTPQKFMPSTDCNTGSPQQIYIYRQRQPNSLFCGNYLRIHSMGAFLLVHTSRATLVHFLILPKKYIQP